VTDSKRYIRREITDYRIYHLIFFVQDTAGSERFESMSTLYYRGAKAAIVCYGKLSQHFEREK